MSVVLRSNCPTAHEKLHYGKCPWCGLLVVAGMALPTKRIRIEFHGGFKDGQVVTGNLRRSSERLVRVYFLLAEGGRVGKRFRVEPPIGDKEELAKSWESWDAVLATGDVDAISKHALQQPAFQMPQMYEVTHCEDGADEILIQVDAVEDVAAD